MQKKFVIVCLMIMLISPIFSGCTSGNSSLLITAPATKIAFEINEKPDFSGLKLEGLNTDGTYSMIGLNSSDFSEIDTSTPGEKVVVISKNNLTTSFKIYVAHHVVTPESNLKQVIANANEKDIIYIKKGEYAPINATDNSLKDIIIDKSLTLVGDGKTETIIKGNFIVGASSVNNTYVAIENFKDVSFLNLGMKLDYTVQNGMTIYSQPYGITDYNGAIMCFNTENLRLVNCAFNGYAYGVNGESVKGLTINKCDFSKILVHAVRTRINSQNISIVKNTFMDIGKNIIKASGSEQDTTGAIELAFNKEGNAGIVIANNTFSRVSLHDGGLIYYNETSKTVTESNKLDVATMSYIKNSAIITLFSSGENNLAVGGVILSMNNYGSTLVNIRLNTKTDNFVIQTGIVINEMY